MSYGGQEDYVDRFKWKLLNNFSSEIVWLQCVVWSYTKYNYRTWNILFKRVPPPPPNPTHKLLFFKDFMQTILSSQSTEVIYKSKNKICQSSWKPCCGSDDTGKWLYNVVLLLFWNLLWYTMRSTQVNNGIRWFLSSEFCGFLPSSRHKIQYTHLTFIQLPVYYVIIPSIQLPGLLQCLWWFMFTTYSTTFLSLF